ncbi:MAG: leucine-rich repeat protein [Treponema sp.]|nr:leucine-rich repeat protein [Treponema sp.]
MKNFFKLIAFIVIGIIIGLSLIACDPITGGNECSVCGEVDCVCIAVTGVTLNLSTHTMLPGNTIKLDETVEPPEAANKAVTWSSNNTSVATVNNGTVTAVSVGEATITVTTVNGNKTATCVVTVMGGEPTEGLSFTLINDDTEYEVSYGSATAAIIVIPVEHNGKPVTSINYFAYKTNITSVIIPNSITNIEGGAFAGSSNLTSIVIPNSVTSIGNSVFSDCTSLTSVVLPDSITDIGSFMFRDCSSLASIIIPNSVTSIGRDAFRGCTSLTNIVIPNSVTSIDSQVFQNCNNLSSITIPFVGETLDGTTNTNFNYLFGSVSPPPSLKTVVITRGSSIKENAFSDCVNITSISIPASVTSIGNNAFRNCKNLENITVASGNTVYKSQGNCVIQIADNTLIVGTKNSIIPSGVTSIGANAFNGSGITSIIIPNSVTSIGNYAFANSDLKNITIPDNVTDIGAFTFQYSALTNIIIPNSITAINEYTFAYCYDLKSMVLPESVTSIHTYSFTNTTLDILFFKGTYIPWNAYHIQNISRHAVYYYYEIEPTEEGNFWYFDNNGNPAIWEINTIPVAFSNVTQNGSASETTTELTLTFNQAIPGLSASDINLSGVAGVSGVALSGYGPTYTLSISGFSSGGSLNVEVSKSGYEFNPASRTVTIYFDSSSGDAIASQYQKSYTGMFFIAKGTPYSGATLTANSIISGGTTIATNVSTSATGGTISTSGITLFTWVYIYEGSTPIGIASTTSAGAIQLVFGRASVESIVTGWASFSGTKPSYSGISDDYSGILQ